MARTVKAEFSRPSGMATTLRFARKADRRTAKVALAIEVAIVVADMEADKA